MSGDLSKNLISKEICGQNSTKVVINESTAHKTTDSFEDIPQNTCIKSESTEEYIEVKTEPQEVEHLSEDGLMSIEPNERQHQIEEANSFIQRNRSLATIAGSFSDISSEKRELNANQLRAPSHQYFSRKKSLTCPECQLQTHSKNAFGKHMNSVHRIYLCANCEKACPGLESLAIHMTEHESRVNNHFKCDAKGCRFECTDSQLFSEHKKQHLGEKLDEIISEFQSGLKRVEIKTEIEEQNTDFVNVELFLAQNSGQNKQNNDVLDVKVVDSKANERQSNPCPEQPVAESLSSSATVRRIRGLNSAREPIRLVRQSTKKISELFKS